MGSTDKVLAATQDGEQRVQQINPGWTKISSGNDIMAVILRYSRDNNPYELWLSSTNFNIFTEQTITLKGLQENQDTARDALLEINNVSHAPSLHLLSSGNTLPDGVTALSWHRVSGDNGTIAYFCKESPTAQHWWFINAASMAGGFQSSSPVNWTIANSTQTAAQSDVSKWGNQLYTKHTIKS